MVSKSIITTNSASETEKLGRKIASGLCGRKLLLFGELGLGKTTFLRGLAVGLGVQEKIKSPTFVYEKIYQISSCHSEFISEPLDKDSKIPDHSFDKLRAGIRNDTFKSEFVHLDMYRLDSINAEMTERLKELFSSPATVAVEWGERIPVSLLPASRTEIHFSERRIGGREITILKYGN